MTSAARREIVGQLSVHWEITSQRCLTQWGIGGVTVQRQGHKVQCAVPQLKDAHRSAPAAVIESGPAPAVHGVVRWLAVGVCEWLFVEFRVSFSKQNLSRGLRGEGYHKLSARPRNHAQWGGGHLREVSIYTSIWDSGGSSLFLALQLRLSRAGSRLKG